MHRPILQATIDESGYALDTTCRTVFMELVFRPVTCSAAPADHNFRWSIPASGCRPLRSRNMSAENPTGGTMFGCRVDQSVRTKIMEDANCALQPAPVIHALRELIMKPTKLGMLKTRIDASGIRARGSRLRPFVVHERFAAVAITLRATMPFDNSLFTSVLEPLASLHAMPLLILRG
jgi:hypothetical protein